MNAMVLKKISRWFLMWLLIPIGLFLLFDFFYANVRHLFYNYVYSFLIPYIELIAKHNFLLANPIEIFLHDVLTETLYIILVLLILWKINFNLKILKQINFKTIALFFVLIIVLQLCIFFIYTACINISNSIFSYNIHFNSFEEKYDFYWRKLIHIILADIFKHGIMEELLFRVLCVFVIYKFSKSIIWSILLSSMIFNLSHFYQTGNIFPFIFLVKKYEFWHCIFNHKFIGGVIFILFVIISNSLIVPIFYHFSHNILNSILNGRFKPLIICTVKASNENLFILGISAEEFFYTLTSIIFLLILIIIFLRKKKYYLERYEENWLKPVSKLISKTES